MAMIPRRVEEVQRIFAAMGLGRHEDRQRFTDFSGTPGGGLDALVEGDQEQMFIRSESNTFPTDEAQDG